LLIYTFVCSFAFVGFFSLFLESCKLSWPGSFCLCFRYCWDPLIVYLLSYSSYTGLVWPFGVQVLVVVATMGCSWVWATMGVESTSLPPFACRSCLPIDTRYVGQKGKHCIHCGGKTCVFSGTMNSDVFCFKLFQQFVPLV